MPSNKTLQYTVNASGCIEPYQFQRENNRVAERIAHAVNCKMEVISIT